MSTVLSGNISATRQWVTRLISLVLLAPLLWLSQPVFAQSAAEPDMDDMRRSIDVFAGVLSESLDLNVRQSIFHPRSGDVRGRYLAGQGVVLELATPLRARRGMMGRYALHQSISDLSEQIDSRWGNRQLLVQRPDTDAMREALALSMRRDQAAAYYRQLMEQLASIDGHDAVDSALRAAASSARALRNMGELSEEVFEAQIQELNQLRTQLAEHLAQREALQRELREAGADQQSEPDEQTRERWQEALVSLRGQLDELGELASRHSSAMRARTDSMREQQLAAWQQELEDFELRLFETLCDYGASLRPLPDDEHLSLVLTGLGAEMEDGTRADRIHVIGKQSLIRCQRGDIDATGLRTAARSYDM